MKSRQHIGEKKNSPDLSASVHSPLHSRRMAALRVPDSDAAFAPQDTAEFRRRYRGNVIGAGHDFANIPVTSPEASARATIQAQLTIGAPGDKHEQEADQVAAPVVSQINAPASRAMEQISRATGQMSRVQAGEVGVAATPGLEACIQQARGSGRPLADNIRKPMEQAFGADFSRVKVHTDGRSDQLNRSIRAQAFTTGQDVFLRQGGLDPGSREGQQGEPQLTPPLAHSSVLGAPQRAAAMKAAHTTIGTTRLNRLISPSAPAPETLTTASPHADIRQQPGRSALPPTAGDKSPEEAPPIVYEVLRSPGAPLDAGTRSLMEERLGADFSHVRVHTDARAAASAQAVNALAYTHGSSIVFDSARYAPHDEEGRNLLAHELVHTMQQRRSGPPPSNQPLKVGSPHSPGEHEAGVIAQASATSAIHSNHAALTTDHVLAIVNDGLKRSAQDRARGRTSSVSIGSAALQRTTKEQIDEAGKFWQEFKGESDEAHRWLTPYADQILKGDQIGQAQGLRTWTYNHWNKNHASFVEVNTAITNSRQGMGQLKTELGHDTSTQPDVTTYAPRVTLAHELKSITTEKQGDVDSACQEAIKQLDLRTVTPSYNLPYDSWDAEIYVRNADNPWPYTPTTVPTGDKPSPYDLAEIASKRTLGKPVQVPKVRVRVYHDRWPHFEVLISKM